MVWNDNENKWWKYYQRQYLVKHNRNSVKNDIQNVKLYNISIFSYNDNHITKHCFFAKFIIKSLPVHLYQSIINWNNF